MALATVKELLQKAEAGGYAIGAFNCTNMEIIQAIVAAAEEEQAPVIIQASQGAIKYAGLDVIASLTRLLGEKAKIPVAIHLDHGTSFEQCFKCINSGFTSVMIDGSKYSLEENINLTQRVVQCAKRVRVSVEAELGKIGGVEDDIQVSSDEVRFTDPLEAQYFVEKTGVDSLAVAIGTAHGEYKGVPKLDFERLRQIKELVKIPLVLHGSSGVPDEAIQEAISLGIRKINIDTEIRKAFVGAMGQMMKENPEEKDPRKILGSAKTATTDVIRRKIRLFGSTGKA